jgi:hypothetical protein
MYLSPLERDILDGLRHGALDHWQLAADLAAAPFMVRSCLRRLKRHELVREHDSPHVWELTWAGQRAADIPSLMGR